MLEGRYSWLFTGLISFCFLHEVKLVDGFAKGPQPNKAGVLLLKKC
jgi:hypothetical protein